MLRPVAILFGVVPFTMQMSIAEPAAAPVQACLDADILTLDCDAAQLAGARVVYLDPDTGEILTGDAADQAARDASRISFATDMAAEMRRNFSAVGLTELRSEAGGVALNLEGRFQSPLVAIIGDDGQITMGHLGVETPQE